MKIFYSVFLLLLALFAACSGPKNVTKNVDQPIDPYQRDAIDFTIEGDTSLIHVRSEYIEGISQFELGNYYEAIDHLLTAYIKMPQFAGVNYALADAYLQVRDLDNATFYGLESVRINPENKYYRVKLAEIYGAGGNADGVIFQLEKAAEYHKSDLEILYLLANTLNKQRKLLEANDVFSRMLKYTGEDIQILYSKFKNFDELGLTDSALVTLKRMEKAAPENLNTLNTLTRYYLEKGMTAPAKKTMSKALKIKPDDTQTIINLADIYISESKWDSAAVTLNAIISDSVTTARNKMDLVQYIYGKFREDPSNQELAKATETLIETFVIHQPDFAYGHALASDFYLASGQEEKAVQELLTTTELMPQNDVAWKTLVQILYSQGDYEQTIEKGIQSDEIFPDDALIQFFVGASYFVLNKNTEALKWLQNATNAPADPSLKSAIFGMMGDLESASKRWKESEAYYDRALQLNPNNDNVLNNFAYYLSERTEDEELLQKAQDMAERAVSMNPENAAYLDTYGWILYKKNDLNGALKYIKQSVETEEASAVVLEHLGDVYKKMGDSENAKKWWKKALEKQPDLKSAQEKLRAES